MANGHYERNNKGQFVKGTGAGNGRPKGDLAALVKAATDDGETIVSFFLALAQDHTAKTEHRIKANEWLADRGFGRAREFIDLTTKGKELRMWLGGSNAETI